MHEHEFDILDYRTYFEQWQSTGTAIMLKNTMKLLPKTHAPKGGQFFTKNPVSTPAWQAQWTIDLDAPKKDGSLFALWYLVQEPQLNTKNVHFGPFGYQ